MNTTDRLARTDLISRAHASGERAYQIARRLGIPPQTVHYTLRRLGIPPVRLGNQFGRKGSQFDRDAAVMEYIDGGKCEELAKKYRTSPMTLKRELARRGIPRYVMGVAARKVMNLPDDPASIGYIAGLIDGEGTIMNKPYFRCVTIANTDIPMIEWLGRIGGSVQWRTKQAKDGIIRKPIAAWTVSDAVGMHRLLTAIEPYLITKRGKAQALLDTLEARYPTLLHTSWHRAR
jgi:hypothetical protein